MSEVLLKKCHFFFSFLFFFLFRAAPVAYEISQGRGLIGATDAGLHHRHSNTRSKLCLQTTPELMVASEP